jgi:hypothetical protein
MSEIRKGTAGSKQEGGGAAPSGDGGNVHYPKNQGTSDDKVGGKSPNKGDGSGLNVSIGRK